MIDRFIALASDAVTNGHPGPAHRHLMRAADYGSMTDDQTDRWAEVSERLDVLEMSTGMRWGAPVDKADYPPEGNEEP